MTAARIRAAQLLAGAAEAGPKKALFEFLQRNLEVPVAEQVEKENFPKFSVRDPFLFCQIWQDLSFSFPSLSFGNCTDPR